MRLLPRYNFAETWAAIAINRRKKRVKDRNKARFFLTITSTSASSELINPSAVNLSLIKLRILSTITILIDAASEFCCRPLRKLSEVILRGDMEYTAKNNKNII
ncbi:MAG: hypothetical protein C0402_04700 [Thermodesulfovibrio sp.]|nr:hypothetical protein [Thermodesulfovibrio sp.]